MAKITTAVVKAALDEKYGKLKWRRLTKRKFEYKNVVAMPDGSEGESVLLNGKLNWRIYRDSEFESEAIFVIDDGEKILLMTESAETLPSSCFEFGAYYASEMDTLGFFVKFKPEFEDAFNEDAEIYGDNLREYSIAGLQDLFEKSNMILENEQECMFGVYNSQNEAGQSLMEAIQSGSFDTLTFEDTKENIEMLKKMLVDFGMKFNPDLTEESY